MSGTATPPKTTAGGSYEVSRPHGRCAVTDRVIEPGDKFMAALRETAIGFERVDCSVDHWEALDKAGIVAFWRTTMPRAEQKKKIFVDDEVLCGLFERLADTTEPAKLNFRFVLGLILMRKRLLVYESSRKEGEPGSQQEIWSMRFRGREELMDLLDPRLSEDQMKEVSQQLGEILNEAV